MNLSPGNDQLTHGLAGLRTTRIQQYRQRIAGGDNVQLNLKPVVENIASKINEGSCYNSRVKKPTLRICENTRCDCIIVTAALRDRDAGQPKNTPAKSWESSITSGPH
jgi:hypothetical protein